MTSDKELASAQVIMFPASRASMDGRTIITVNNVSDFAPDSKAVEAVTGLFRNKRFEVGPVVGISFSITASVDTFENFLSITLRHRKHGELEFFSRRKRLGRELSSEQLPKALRDYVQAIALPLPPDFGPTKW